MTSAKPTPRADQRFFDLGVQYYVAARFAAMARLMPVSGNLYHHAVEMLLKGQLAKTMPLDQLKKSFSHRLPAIWEAFKALFPDDLSAFDALITDLDRFEVIRYPDAVLKQGMIGVIGWRPAGYQMTSSHGHKVPRYEYAVTDLDHLIRELFRLCSMNPVAYLGFLNEHGVRVLENENPACQGWFPERHGQQVGSGN